MRACEVMRTPVVTVSPDATLTETAQRMRECTVGCVVVVSGDAVHGIVTDRDLAVRGLAAEASATTPVSEVMTAPALTVGPDDDVDESYHTMRRAGVRRLPVVAGGRLMGLVTMDDLLMDVSRRLGELLEPLSWCALAEPPGPPHSEDEASGHSRAQKHSRAPGL
ncbi:CBS domain-containing protein [Streptomyces lydicus]|uniref:CBS domain-containing protein n=1 Tax=Streptomyces lydicus TaxID=47763 RepID=A0A3Q9K634_9ACTN|nr:CBS domain-containing protein [Streptomyces lydicus]AZS69826.1 CBS domain-containing protein [Streptomyces lydicus]